MPDEPEALGLMALMLLHDARRQARFAGEEIVLLSDQDRSLWNVAQITEGRATLDRALSFGYRGPYQVQAAIASLQSADELDWRQIVALYGELVRLTGSAVVELNGAVAIVEAGAPEAALAIVEGLALDDYRYLHSTRAELRRRVARDDEARSAYRRALELAETEPERRSLQRRLGEL